MRADVPGVPPPQEPFYFTLGNVSGLEKKLEHAQDLGVAPRDYVAVTYVSRRAGAASC